MVGSHGSAAGDRPTGSNCLADRRAGVIVELAPHCGSIFPDLLRRCGPKQHARDPRLLHRPGEYQVGQLAAEPCRHGPDGIHEVEVPIELWSVEDRILVAAIARRERLATTHLALADVPRAITRDSLRSTMAIIHQDLMTRFGIANPRILVTGLNPHAGEEGYLGREEIDVIRPVIDEVRARGWQVSGPYPADTLFQPRYLDQADCVLAMYHDQGLPVLKFATFGQGVNITLGLPVIRTSVDHGTALDKAAAGYGHADAASMVEAIAVAAQMATAQQ